MVQNHCRELRMTGHRPLALRCVNAVCMTSSHLTALVGITLAGSAANAVVGSDAHACMWTSGRRFDVPSGVVARQRLVNKQP